ncbi:MAG: TetR/AcrR family transcriptional regulator [Acetobacter sp.]|nr:TetR/AcrR family transcriptional regulator [Bacteroides sp.]MCM1341170.1 TetR/AcrR family transcriptional regulator [Acetobacter sp.]MCM1433496.1 TetR/AcrR family transcriptional regulator [Clostridiales bacterium]
MDRRIKRTRTAIFNAVLELIVEKEANRITVLELCNKADINKSTFYLHYKSMDDCLQACFQIIMDGVIELSKHISYYDIASDPKPTIDILLNEIEKSLEYLKKFKSSNICGPSLKVLKENLVACIAENSGFTTEENYCEIANIAYTVAGFIDAVMYQLPNYNKPLLSKVTCSMIKG